MTDVGTITLADDCVRDTLIDEDAVVVYRNERTTGATWWRSESAGQKRGDVLVSELNGPVAPESLALADYLAYSAFDSLSEWQTVIQDRKSAPAEGYLYLVLRRGLR